MEVYSAFSTLTSTGGGGGAGDSAPTRAGNLVDQVVEMDTFQQIQF